MAAEIKPPPQTLEGEMALLGSMMLDKKGEYAQAALVDISAEDFYHASHRTIFEALLAVTQETADDEWPCMVRLRNELRRLGKLEEVGGVDALTALADSVPSPVNAAHYARMVKERSFARKVISASASLMQAAYDDTTRASELLWHIENKLMPLVEPVVAEDYTRLSDVTESVVDAHLHPADAHYVQSGFRDLDEKLGGFKPGEMTVIAGRPSMGKTAMALQMLYTAASNDLPVGLLSLEMNKASIADRCFRFLGGPGVPEHEWRQRQEDLDKLPLWIGDKSSLTPMQLRLTAKRMVRAHKIKVLCIDYLQLMKAPKCESRIEEVSIVARYCKALAKELNIAVLVLSQLNRAAEARSDHKPQMGDLRQSGEIEQVADVVILLHRDDYYHKGESGYEPNNLTDVIVAKNRNGPTGAVYLMWLGEQMKFGNRSIYA